MPPTAELGGNILCTQMRLQVTIIPVLHNCCVCAQGNLKQYLVSVGDGVTGMRPPSTAERLCMCRQVVLAMKHIASMKLAHGDLAARNLLVTSNFDVKLCKASLCVDAFSKEYIVHRRRPLPLRWAAPETVVQTTDRSTASADIWAFGVVIWELFTPHCPLPMADRSDAEVLMMLELLAGSSASTKCPLVCPVNCPEPVWNIARCCMSRLPASRPKFSDILSNLDDMNFLDDSQV